LFDRITGGRTREAGIDSHRSGDREPVRGIDAIEQHDISVSEAVA
jgi:hypothetical protein